MLAGSGNGAIGGAIGNGGSGATLGVTVQGSGLWTLAGINTYTGPTLVGAGGLSLTGMLSGSSVTVNGAALNGTSTGVIGASASFTLAGGSATFAGNNTYSGGTFISGGTLDVTTGGAINHSGQTLDFTGAGSELIVQGGSVTAGQLRWAKRRHRRLRGPRAKRLDYPAGQR